jgi:hypothetical protein
MAVMNLRGNGMPWPITKQCAVSARAEPGSADDAPMSALQQKS